MAGKLYRTKEGRGAGYLSDLVVYTAEQMQRFEAAGMHVPPVCSRSDRKAHERIRNARSATELETYYRSRRWMMKSSGAPVTIMQIESRHNGTFLVVEDEDGRIGTVRACQLLPMSD